MLRRLSDIDTRLLVAIRTRGHGPSMEEVAKLLGRIGEYGAVWLGIGLAVGALVDHDAGQWIAAGLLAPFSIGLNFAVKVLVRRQRPVLEGLPPLGGAPSSLSFPSAHTTSSFATATAMTRIDSEAAWLFILAFGIALCRPYLGMHYPSDVLAGAVLGTVLGLLLPLGVFS